MGGREVDPCCQRPRRATDDPFFAPGDRIAFHDCVTVLYVEEQEPLDQENSTPPQQQENETKDASIHNYSVPCGVVGCSKVFQSLSDYEEHYESQHVFECAECGMVFSCNGLLDLHLKEVHDAFFAAALQRKQVHYSCLVHDCSDEFDSLSERYQHLQSQHGYPKWFRFHSHIQHRDEWKKEVRKKQRWMQSHHHHDAMEHHPDSTTGRMQVDGKKQARRQRKKEKRASIPCRFYLSKAGCWRGEQCDFLHEAISNPKKEEKRRGDNGHVEDMDELVKHVERKARISVPDKICFGHGHKGFLS